MDGTLRRTGSRIFRNFMKLVGGRFFGGLLALGATLITARSLGVESFGTLVLVHAYVMLVRGIVNLKPFEAIVRFGAPLLDRGDFSSLCQLLRTTFVIDLCTAVAGTVGALLGIELMLLFGGWGDQTAEIARWYGLVLLACGYGTASGLLRVCDKFGAISLALVIGNTVRFIGAAAISVWGEISVAAFAAVWAGSLILRFLCLQLFGWRTALKTIPASDLRGGISFREVSRRHPGIWHFVHIVYWNSTLDLVPKSVGTLAAGALLGAEQAGLFRIAREFANVISKPALLIRQAVYPDLARLQDRRDSAFGRIVVAVVLVLSLPAIALTVLTVFFGEWALSTFVGSDFAPAATVLSWLALSAAIEVTAAPLRPAAYALGRARAALFLQIMAVAGYCYLFVQLTPMFGLIGLGLATLALWSTVLAGMTYLVTTALRAQGPA